MKVEGSYIVFPHSPPNDSPARTAMLHGQGAAHYWRNFEVDIPDELASDPDKWFANHSKAEFADMVKKMPGKIPMWAGYTLDHYEPSECIDVSYYKGKPTIRIMRDAQTAVFFYLA